jgi:hypothetical protein
MNLDQIEKTVRFLIDLGPNDVKLLVIAEEKNFVLKERSDETLTRLRGHLQRFPEDQFVLLRTKIENLFNPIATGLGDAGTQKVMQNCFIPMTERTLDSRHYYPCSIYVRYYGQPIGDISDSFATQQQKVLEFVREHNCRQDPICREHCTNCCKVFNVRTNTELVINENQTLIITEKIKPAERKFLREQVATLIARGKPLDKAFLIIKPHGQQWRQPILDILARHGLTPKTIRRIECFEECARYLYAWPLTDEELQFTLELDRAFQIIERGSADVVHFNENPTAEELLLLKHELRQLFPTARFAVNLNGEKRVIRLTAVHTPSPADVARENAILNGLFKHR